jgi:hypothetical protein
MQAEPDEDAIREAAILFRRAILRCPRTDLPTLKDFPRGSCGDTSILLGEYLYSRSLGLWEYAAGSRMRDLHSHAWIEHGGLIVDITADQFEEIEEPVIVTRDPGWHRQFVYPEPRHPARIGDYDSGTQSWLRPIYERIQNALEGS